MTSPRLLDAMPWVVLLTCCLTAAAAAAPFSHPPFLEAGDVGSPALAGAAEFDAQAQAFLLRGAGTNMWDRRDECQFVWRKLTGDFQIGATVALAPPQANSNVHRKLGVMIRSSLDGDAAYADIAVHGDGLTSLQYRQAKGEITEQQPASIVGAAYVQLARKGQTITMRVAAEGELLTAPRSVDLDLGDEVYVGLFICSHDAQVVESGTFRNVRLTVPAPDDLVQYRDYLPSDLEIVDVETGRREVVFHAPDSIQAPNWTPDGKALIYNSNGKLYRFDLATKTPSVIDTGFATANNNDHVLSPDGTQIAISHHAQDDQGRSNVYVVPAAGGEPRRVTQQGPSYLHGWSPDGKTLVYTAERGDGNYDIYAIAADGGEETRLTTALQLDDGPEFSPDGSRIYFNSARTGSMQIWRMYPGGGDQEQVTDDELQNWFPHISPDAKLIAYLSFEKEVPADQHPFYKQVFLRLMPYPGGASRVIAYLYGGQGSINVPSWSPDGKQLALVTNSGNL